MSYLSFSFLFFVFLFVFIYYVLPRKLRPSIILCANLLFYFSFGADHFLFLLFVAFFSFFVAKKLSHFHFRKPLFFLCILAIVALWFSNKLLPWIIELTNYFFQWRISMPVLSLFTPIGISYYSLQAISYLVDVYRGKIEPERHFFKYLLYLSYFPAIIQGPVSRYDQLSPQLLCNTKFDYEQIVYNLTLILLGVTKKMVLADRLGIFVNNCFSNFQNLNGLILYTGAVFFAIELYADFSGCVDICRGVSGLFGIDLVQNFNAPYLSGSIQEFWRNWHMSFSNWLKDYVYIPLGGNRKGKVRKYLNLILTFLISGAWHGAGVTYLIWGFLQAIYQITGTLTSPLRSHIKRFFAIKEDSFADKLYKIVITFNLTVFSWIFFRSESVTFAIQYISNMFNGIHLGSLFSVTFFRMGLNYFYLTVILLHILLLAGSDCLQKRHIDPVRAIRQQHVLIRWGIYFLLIFDVLLFGVYGTGYSISAFMYGGF